MVYPPIFKQTERQIRARQDSDNVLQNVSSLSTIVEKSGKGVISTQWIPRP